MSISDFFRVFVFVLGIGAGALLALSLFVSNHSEGREFGVVDTIRLILVSMMMFAIVFLVGR